MLTSERHTVILNLLKKHQTIKIQDILQATNASESTIRRDLTELENNLDLVRIHGGATINKKRLNEFSIDEKSAINIHDKIKIAKYAASFVDHGDCIYLDTGTTTLQMIPFINDKDVTIVTNGLNHLELLMKSEQTSYLTGGRIKVKTNALVGPQALESIQKYRFDKCFLGVNGFDLSAGFTTPDPEEAAIKKAALTAAEETFVLADATKHKQIFFARISDLNTATIISNQLSDESIKKLSKQTVIKDVSK